MIRAWNCPATWVLQISDEDWEDFYQCYVSTYFKRSGHAGYLNRDFFAELRRRLPGQLMLVVAQAGRTLAGRRLVPVR